jgi:hypothetical protein
MANWQTLTELRYEGFIATDCDRRMGPFVKDLYGFGDVIGYDPTHLRRPRLVNGCKEDLQLHIRKYLQGGKDEKTGKEYGPNEHLVHLLTWFDLFIYSFVLRTMRNAEGKLLDRKVYQCRKWQAILSPTGQVSFELEVDTK